MCAASTIYAGLDSNFPVWAIAVTAGVGGVIVLAGLFLGAKHCFRLGLPLGLTKSKRSSATVELTTTDPGQTSVCGRTVYSVGGTSAVLLLSPSSPSEISVVPWTNTAAGSLQMHEHVSPQPVLFVYMDACCINGCTFNMRMVLSLKQGVIFKSVKT